jgi:serine phosphatase RsbU (regulator of sigma subunit)
VENPDSKAIRKVLIDNNVVMPHFKYMLKLNSDSQDEKTSIAIGVFVITVAILYLLLYVLGSFEKKYLFGTVFTLSFGMVFVFGNVSDLGTVYSFFSFTFLNLLCPIALVLFVYSFFQYKLSKGVTIYLVWLTAMTFFFSIFTFIIRGSSNKIGSILLLGMIFLILISCLIFTFIALFKAVKEKKPNAKLILIVGFTLIVFTLAILCWLVFSDSPDLAGSNYSKILIMIPLPLIIMIAVVRDYILSNKKVVTQLEEIEGLTALTLKEQEEKRLILSKQNERLEKEVNERTADIKRQKHLLEEKQKEIIDSISYAKRLQDAILPPQEFVDSHIKDNFIYYKPKDIVAGDFYWAEKVGEKFFIAAADSTGHGVPGAMVSVVCSNALNRTIKEFKLTETGKILDKTRELVIETFEKSASEVKDGMDISLLCIDSKNKNIYWSGANNPLWFIQDNELKEIKADKQPIGKTEYAKPFTTHQIEYKADTTFYLFTDGFADQFGGPNGKKFKYKQFSDLLLKNNHLSQKQQSDIINEAFSDWKSDLEQVDDVCVIGIKL